MATGLVMCGSLLALGALSLVVLHYWEQLFVEELARAHRRLIDWIGKGLAFPLLLWSACNFGLLPGFPPLMPEASLAMGRTGNWIVFVFQILAPTWLVIGSCWASVSFGWMLGIMVTREEEHQELLISCGFWSVILGPVMWLICRILGAEGLGLAMLVWLVPVVHFGIPASRWVKPPPTYSRAIARLKFGKYRDAELEVIQQLEQCQEDFEGWMMLADLYANHYQDLPAAQQTIQELCDQPKITGLQVSLACHRLADWQLKPGEDPAAARRALELICRKLPGSHHDHRARQRLAQLPANREELREQQQVRTIPLPALNDALDDVTTPTGPKISRTEAMTLVEQYTKKLQQNPNDVRSRECLARVFAEQLDQADLGVAQLDLLLGMSEPAEQKKAEWLSWMAAWQLRYRHDGPAAQRILKRLIHEHPHSAQAFAAQRRLNLMAMDLKGP